MRGVLSFAVAGIALTRSRVALATLLGGIIRVRAKPSGRGHHAIVITESVPHLEVGTIVEGLRLELKAQVIF
jgi:hypothetical protein